MSLKIEWRYLDGSEFTDITGYFRKFETAFTSNAEEGSVATSTVRAHDPAAELDIIGLAHFRVWEMEAPEGKRCIGQWAATERTISRGDYDRVTVQRVWDINLVDRNEIPTSRVFSQGQAERPAETDVARLAWLMTTSDFSHITDDRYVDTDGPVNMDAVDYRGQTAAAVLSDISQQSGKDWWVWYAEDVDALGLWYGHSVSSNYSSTISLSNDLADIDGSTVFAISLDTELRRDPSRVYAGCYLPYDGGAVYVSEQTTLVDYPLRDFVAPAYNVKTEAKAKARARRYLRDLDTEEDSITTTVILPRAQVNDLMQGMRVQFKATHLPGYTDYVWMRCVRRTVSELNEDEYSVQVELIAPKPAYVSPPVYSVLYRGCRVNNDPQLWFDASGDFPEAGLLPRPTTGLLETIAPESPPKIDRPFSGFKINGTGEVDVFLFSTYIGVLVASHSTSYAVTLSILRNGVVVASETENITIPNGFRGHASGLVTSITGLTVEPDDVLTATMVSDPWMHFFTVPSGAGQSGERFEITGGSLS